MSLGPLYVLLGEVSVQVLCPLLIGLFVFLVWSHVSSLYILQIKPLSEISLTNMFSHTVGSLYNLVLSLAMQKLSILVRFHLCILPFMSLALGDISVKVLLCGISEIFLPMFSWRTFMVSWLMRNNIDASKSSWIWLSLIITYSILSLYFESALYGTNLFTIVIPV